MLIKYFVETADDGHSWYDIYSDADGKSILQVETGIIYGSVAMRDDDPHTYVEVDDPNYCPEEIPDIELIRELEEDSDKINNQ